MTTANQAKTATVTERFLAKDWRYGFDVGYLTDDPKVHHTIPVFAKLYFVPTL